MRKTLIAVAVGALVVLGASAAFAQTDAENPIERVSTFISDALAELVDDGTISTDQAVAVEEALIEAHDERRAEREAMREDMQAARADIEAALEDGVITADEAATLPDSPLTDTDGPLADAWADGELTQDELQEARGDFRGHGPRGFEGRGDFGPGPSGDVPAEEVNA